MTTEEQVIEKIIEALSLLCPVERVTGIEEFVGHFKKLGEAEHPLLSYPESIRVEALNDAIEHIREDIIKNGYSFSWPDDKPKNEYERGVLSVIWLLQHRVHCICD